MPKLTPIPCPRDPSHVVYVVETELTHHTFHAMRCEACKYMVCIEREVPRGEVTAA